MENEFIGETLYTCKTNTCNKLVSRKNNRWLFFLLLNQIIIDEAYFFV